MKQSPYVIALLLGATASVKLNRPESDDLLNIHNAIYDRENGLYRDMAFIDQTVDKNEKKKDITDK